MKNHAKFYNFRLTDCATGAIVWVSDVEVRCQKRHIIQILDVDIFRRK